MNSPLTRKAFLFQTATAAAAAFAVPRLFAQSSARSAASPSVPDRPPQIESVRLKEFVIAGHANLDKVKEMLIAQPEIINGTWDWGGGDFETALGGASHMGRPDIADFLLMNNARLDLFAAAMLGKLEVVKATVVAYPNIVQVLGPHGIPLIAHAEKGGAAAVRVVEFLKPLVAKP